MDAEQARRMYMRVIDDFAAWRAEAAREDALAQTATDATRRAGHKAAARHAAEQAASVRVEVDQIISGLLGLPQA